MKRSVSVLILSVVVLAALAPLWAATVDEALKKISHLPPAQRRAALEESARQEGQVVFYTSMSLTDYPKVMAAFEKAYPFIKPSTYRSTPSSLFTRIDTEVRTGRFAVDVVGSAPVEIWQLKQRGLSGPYLSTELKAFPAGAYDPEGYWASFEVTPIVLALNTKMVPLAEVPKSNEELLSAKWKGRMSLGTDEYEWFAIMLHGMGRQKGIEYMKTLARQELHMPGSSSIMRIHLMMAGESAIAIAARGRRVTEFKEKGAPIDFRITDPYPGEPNSLALMRRAAHPHAALLFIDWILSEEGQSFMAQKVPRMALRKGIRQIPRHQELFKKDFVFVSPALIGPNLKEIIELYQQIFALHRSK
jgi:iron(III) transport system substrate-binding protein